MAELNPGETPSNELKGLKVFAVVSALFEIALLVLFITCTEYSWDVKGNSIQSSEISDRYGYFGDVHVMIFIGFGFLMTFLKKYGLSAVGLTLFLSAIAIQWVILLNGFWANIYETKKDENPGEWQKIQVSIRWFIEGDFGAAAVLITFGAILGKASPIQLLFVTFFEVVFYSLNKMICETILEVVDHGGSIIIHLFGAYFGLTIARIIKRDGQVKNDKNSSTKSSDLFSMVGSVFLWIYWPSFNAALAATSSMQERAILNTVLCLCSSTVTTFFCSIFLRADQKISIIDVENATLAGGVALGSSACLATYPGGAIGIGFVAGAISVLGYVDVQPFLERVIGLHDTCGVHNLHGLPALIGALISAVILGSSKKEDYGIAYSTVVSSDRTPSDQALYQVACLAITLGIAIVGGAITGLFIYPLNRFISDFYEDSANFS